MKRLTIVASLPLVSLMSACGGVSIIDTTGEPTTVSQGTNSGDLRPDTVTPDTFTASNGTTDFVYDHKLEYDKGVIRGYLRSGTTWFDVAAYGETSSGSGTASYINSTEDGFEAAVTFVERIGTTEVPRTGKANFTGDYSAMNYFMTVGDPVYNYVIHGDAELNADLSAMTISGTISNRQDQTFRSYADVTLVDSNIDHGSFGGTATGGELTDGTLSTTINGTYLGLLTGPTAAEAVGSVYLERVDGTQDRYERGIFIVEQSAP